MYKLGLSCVCLWLSLTVVYAYPDTFHYALDLSHESSILVPSDLDNPRYGFVFSKTANAVSIVDLFSRTVVNTLVTPGLTVSACLLAEENKIFFITDQTDQWSSLDFSQNIESPSMSHVNSDTNNVKFESIDCLHVSESSYLVLGDFNTDTLYSYNLDSNDLNQQLDLGFTPIDTVTITPRNQVVVLGEGGELEGYQVPSLQSLGNRIELSNYSGNNNFLQLSQSSIENSTYIFISNPISSASEIFVAQADHQNFLLNMLDFESLSGIDPIQVNTLIGDIYTGLSLRPEGFSSARIYLYLEDLSNNRMRIIDPYVSTTPSNWTEVDTIESVSNLTSMGNFIDGNNNLFILDDNNNTLRVFSDLPLINLTGADLNIGNENNYSFSVLSDTSGTLKVKRMDDDSEITLPQAVKTYTSTSITANQNKSVSIGTSDFIEGNNLLGVFVESSSTEGYRGIKVFKDTIPPYPNDYKLKFGHQKIFVSWDGVNQADIDYYEVSFGLDAQASDGAGLISPVIVNHTGTGNYNYTINSLVNGQRVYVKIKTVDKQGNESDYSPILSEVPEETIGLIALTGETGCQSATSKSNSFGLLLFVLVLLKINIRQSITLRKYE
ncbi:MAG TPA: hypothetical protein PKB05_09140 [Oligoflexia bacterium]|nr:hypothetical protein [Oligoflexia bacterium]